MKKATKLFQKHLILIYSNLLSFFCLQFILCLLLVHSFQESFLFVFSFSGRQIMNSIFWSVLSSFLEKPHQHQFQFWRLFLIPLGCGIPQMPWFPRQWLQARGLIHHCLRSLIILCIFIYHLTLDYVMADQYHTCWPRSWH